MKVLISGGGTGGHLFPAMAIAEKLMEHDPDTAILFVGAKGKIEMERVPKAGYNIKGLWISGIDRNLKSPKNLLFPFKLLTSLVKSFWIVLRFRPDIGIGVGGFASGPALFMARLLGTPILIQEQNSFPGITNKLLGKRADKVCVSYDGMQRFFGQAAIVRTGNPVRKVLQSPFLDRAAAASYFGLDPNKQIVFVFGGSLGARSVNKSLMQSVDYFKAKPDIQLIWQTGKVSFAACSQSELAKLENVQVRQFIDRMEMAYALSDVVVGRAGALTISELCLQQKASILVPLPSAAEDHQTKNAMALVEKNAAVLVKDKDLEEGLVPAIEELLTNKKMRDSLIRNIASLGQKDATAKIVEEINDLLR
ncbi:MAG: undecaprenyldiphospho-muramoylpentapeptide beta-N-acetylglucosaminyltransferase [Saprospiraceae bacterium]|nr:undecaprenyldiphospho-muramoylpentapeptide beta-N-acetylglucosaminyltransferase [Saprospiraceae bacterium]